MISATFVSKVDFVRAVLAELSPKQVALAADPERGVCRGWASLEDVGVVDAGQLALDCGLPEPDGSGERWALINEYVEAASAALIAKGEEANRG